jgi:hypothetical protein
MYINTGVHLELDRSVRHGSASSNLTRARHIGNKWHTFPHTHTHTTIKSRTLIRQRHFYCVTTFATALIKATRRHNADRDNEYLTTYLPTHLPTYLLTSQPHSHAFVRQSLRKVERAPSPQIPFAAAPLNQFILANIVTTHLLPTQPTGLLSSCNFNSAINICLSIFIHLRLIQLRYL